jgi:hypothetical protein
MLRKQGLVRGLIWERPIPGLVLGLMVLTLSFASATGAAAQEPGWTEWERSHSVARQKDWLVIDPPGESACYLKQSYPGPERMEISLIRGGDLLVCGPFYPKEPGRAELTYRFHPGGESRTLRRGEITNCIALPKDLLPGFKSGYVISLQVVLLDREGTVREQEFSLMGFTAAYEVLQSGVCSP